MHLLWGHAAHAAHGVGKRHAHTALLLLCLHLLRLLLSHESLLLQSGSLLHHSRVHYDRVLVLQGAKRPCRLTHSWMLRLLLLEHLGLLRL